MKFSGKVIKGVNVGSKFGVATANIRPGNMPDLVSGVYLVYVFVEEEAEMKKYNGLLHFGKRETFGGDFSTEVHILDFDEDIYDKIIEIEIFKYFREIKAFQNADQLFTQIEKDIILARKSFVREEIRSVWAGLSIEAQQVFSEKAIEHLSAFSVFLETQNIFIYAPQINREVCFVSALMAAYPDKKYFFPRVDKKNNMDFYSVKNITELLPGKFNLREPKKDSKNKAKQKDLDSALVFVPSVAIDEEMHRLGRGGGFYDRFLCDIPRGIKKIAVMPQFAVLKEVPTEVHDQAIDKVIIC